MRKFLLSQQIQEQSPQQSIHIKGKIIVKQSLVCVTGILAQQVQYEWGINRPSVIDRYPPGGRRQAAWQAGRKRSESPVAQHVATPGCLDETDISYLPTHQGLSGLYMILISTERNKCTNGYVNRIALSIFKSYTT